MCSKFATQTIKSISNILNIRVDATTFDLLSKMLELDPKKRINCKEALNHKFFSDSHHPKALEPQEYNF